MNFILSSLSFKPMAKSALMKEFFLFKIVTPYDLIFNIVIGSFSGIGLIAAINFGASITGRTQSSFVAAGVFLIFLYVFRISQISLLESCAGAVELHLEEIRTEIVKKLASIEYNRLETIPKDYLFSGITKHYDVVNNGVVPLTSAVRSIPLVILLLLYLSSISIAAAIILILLCFTCTRFYLARLIQIRNDLKQMYISETRLLGQIDDLLKGFIELKFSEKK